MRIDERCIGVQFAESNFAFYLKNHLAFATLQLEFYLFPH